jgi:predicted metal-dependent phosphoesterase TrpH
MRCDLHMHSTLSDGSLSVPELVQAVASAGVAVFALTDHDSVDGVAIAREEGRRLGLELVSGVELSTRLDRMELHILGYGFDPEHAGLAARLEEQKAARHVRIPAIVERLQHLGIAISVDDVYRAADGGNPGRPHVARALLALGVVKSTQEAFERYLGDGGPAQVRKVVPSPGEAIRWIHEAGGKAAWAHPLVRPIQRPGGFDQLARELVQQGLDGLEEVHPAQDPGARKRIRKLCRELDVVPTGGSDFHGEATPGVTLGKGRGHDEVLTTRLEALLAR